MFSTSLVLLSDQVALQQMVDVVANNIANSSTTAFKRQGIQFSTYLDNKTPSQTTSFVYNSSTYRDTTAGTITSTGNPLDLAIQGDGFFQIQTPDGIEYTRNGAFRTNDQGQIVTSSGLPVLSDGSQPITLPEDARDITISSDGFITAQTGTSTSRAQLGKVGMVRFADSSLLVPTSNGLLATEQEAEAATQRFRRRGSTINLPNSKPTLATEEPTPAEQSQLVQGALETSNVNPVTEMTDLIRIQRAYEQATNLIGQENTRIEDMFDKITQSMS